MRKQLQGRYPRDLCEVVCVQIDYGSLMVRRAAQGRREFLDQRHRQGGPYCSENVAHRRRRIPISRSVIDTFCPRRGRREMISGAVRRRVAMSRSFVRMGHRRSGLSSPRNQHPKTLDEASKWQQQLHGACPSDIGEGVGGQREYQTLAVSRTQQVRRSIQGCLTCEMGAQRWMWALPRQGSRMRRPADRLCCRGCAVYPRPRLLISRSFIDTFCRRRDVMETTRGVVHSAGGREKENDVQAETSSRGSRSEPRPEN